MPQFDQIHYGVMYRCAVHRMLITDSRLVSGKQHRLLRIGVGASDVLPAGRVMCTGQPTC